MLSETAATLLASVSGILLFDSGNDLLALYPMALSGMRRNSDGPMNNRRAMATRVGFLEIGGTEFPVWNRPKYQNFA